jgi:hypothetical protein
VAVLVDTVTSQQQLLEGMGFQLGSGPAWLSFLVFTCYSEGGGGCWADGQFALGRGTATAAAAASIIMALVQQEAGVKCKRGVR